MCFDFSSGNNIISIFFYIVFVLFTKWNRHFCICFYVCVLAFLVYNLISIHRSVSLITKNIFFL